tara:strand:- start:20027 stop:20821 length:795 start_codon:yes stop_codon:yes gene_type:complete
MIEQIKYIFLGLIQGLTEFFPISSSGHLELFSYISNIAQEEPLLLFIIVHLATALSTIIVYRNRIKKMLIGVITDNNKNEFSFLIKLAISSIPTLLIYLVFSKNIDLIFKNATHLVCIMLVLTGSVLFITQFFIKSDKKIGYLDALLIGLAQALAIIPGVSRSGATISTALFLKINRDDAAEFSFLMGLAPILGGSFLKIFEFLSSPSTLEQVEIKGLLLSFFAAFFSGLFACKYMIVLVQKNNLKFFGYYCVLLGISFWIFIL